MALKILNWYIYCLFVWSFYSDSLKDFLRRLLLVWLGFYGFFKRKFWVEGGDKKVCEPFFIQYLYSIFFIQINVTHYFKSSAFLFIILHSLLLAAVLCDNMLCKQEALLQNFKRPITHLVGIFAYTSTVFKKTKFANFMSYNLSLSTC